MPHDPKPAPLPPALTPTEGLPQHLRDHLPKAYEAAVRNQQRAMAAAGKASDALDRQILEVKSPRVPAAAKVIRIRHLAAEVSALVAPFTACSKGCAHCCHVAVSVPRTEAKMIAKATGRKLAEPASIYRVDAEEGRRDYFGVPCTFLQAGKCSIYEHRPLACRTLINMDSSDLLCQLVPGVEVPVTYLDTSVIKGVFVTLLQNDDFADVRDWFPNPS